MTDSVLKSWREVGLSRKPSPGDIYQDANEDEWLIRAADEYTVDLCLVVIPQWFDQGVTYPEFCDYMGVPDPMPIRRKSGGQEWVI